MHLRNLDIRIKQYPRGYVVERKVYNGWFKPKKWEHLISVSGIDDMPWYYTTHQNALDQAKLLFGWDLLIGTNE